MKKMTFLKSLDKQVTEIPVSEIMIRAVRTLSEEDSVQKAIDIMAEYSISGLLITSKAGYPLGIVSEGDMLKKVFHKKKDPKNIILKDIMTTHLFTIKPSLSIGATSILMKRHNISKLPVVENNRLVGYVTKSDLLEKMNELYYQNTRLKWLPVVVMMQLIFIAILLSLLLKQ